MGGIRDLLTDFALAGATILFSAWLVLTGGRWIAQQLAAMRPYLTAFLVFTFVAMNYAQKRSAGGGASAPVPAPLFNSASVSTNGAWDFSAPSGATVHERWRRRGAADDWFMLSPTGWSFALGDMSVTNLAVFSFGKARLPGGIEVSPLPATLGIVPETNWGLLGESNSPSLFWHGVTDCGSLLLTWQNVLLHRVATNPVSFQAELRPSGGVTFRYDLSRLASDDPISGLTPAADGVLPDVPLSRGVTGVSFKSRDEALCDEARTAFEESLGGLDPLSFPEGSTNTVLEHLFYSGTTNGAFAFPQTNDTTAVLRVAVTGSGSGDLLVNGSYVPLAAPPQMRGGTPQGNPLMFPVTKGLTVPVYLRGDGTLSVSFDSGEFAFGELPSLSEHRHMGWINFPNTKATEPCIHDLGVTTKGVELPASGGAEDLVCEWQGGSGVTVENRPPRSATLTASFDPKQSRSITYTLSHPNRLFGRTEYQQTVRYCPRPDDDEPPFAEYEDEDDDGNYWCACCGWPCGDCGCPDSCDCVCCDHGICPEHSVPYGECASIHEDYEHASTNAFLAGVLYIRDPPVVGDQIDLEVPSGHVICCPCPSHWTNSVSVAYMSHRLRVTDSEGLPFCSTATDCTVDVAGVAPSKAVGDAELAFARNGEVYERRGYTVLGVGIRRDGIPLSRYNSLSPSLGLPMTVCTNRWDAPELKLVSNVKLPTGSMRIELANATGQFAVWCRDGEGWRKLAETGAAGNFPMHAWKAVLRGAGCEDFHELPVRITSSSPGSARLVFRYWNVIGGAFAEDVAEQRITSVNPPLLVDYNRDGRIDALDVARCLCGRVAYFWRNNDTWKYDDAFSSSSALNSADGIVNGRNDLINFLPIAVDVGALAANWGSGAVYYRLEADTSPLRSAKLAFADVGWGQVGDAPFGSDCDLDGTPLHEASVSTMGAGTNLPPAFVALAGTESSTIIMEFPEAAGHDSLWFCAYSSDDDALLFSAPLPLHVGSVENMVGWENLRGIAGGSGGVPTRIGAPDWPDSEREPGNVVFVHGYNMEENDEARLWAVNVFKKLWWAGLDRGFVAVQWRGNEGQLPLTLPEVGYVTPNYYANVQNAFATASALKAAMDGMQGPKWFLAHSLGNMLVSAAIQDCHMTCEKYFMLNAAVAMEAYDPTNGISQASHDNMTPEVWVDYADRVRATHWHELFSVGDGRRLLTWKGRFADVTDVINFYSSQDEVVCNGDGMEKDIGRAYAWYTQETCKGNWTWMLHANEGGWGFNHNYGTTTYSYLGNELIETWNPLPPSDASSLSDSELQQTPFFLDFANSQMHTTSNGLIVATNYLYSAEMLAYAIPSESYAVGANPLPCLEELSQNVNLTDFTCGQIDLPQNGTTVSDRHRDWQHSTFVQRSYKRTCQLFRKIIRTIKEE